MTIRKITVVDDFNPHPYGRSISVDGETSGEKFRIDILTPALNENESVHVDLTGYNRYGRSFLDEAFGGLIREDGFSAEELEKKLTYSHARVEDIVTIIDERIRAAATAEG